MNAKNLYARMRPFVLSVNGAATAVLPANDRRIGIMLQPGIGAFVTVAFGEPVTALSGILLHDPAVGVAKNPIWLDESTLGDSIRAEMNAFDTAGGSNIFGYELLSTADRK